MKGYKTIWPAIHKAPIIFFKHGKMFPKIDTVTKLEVKLTH